MANNPRAGQPAAPSDLVDVPRLITAYYSEHPDPSDPGQQVSFGTSGHRGSSLRVNFNDDHIAAITQAICDYRAGAGIDGPLFLARDTHALSEPAWVTALEVLAANGTTVLIDAQDGYTPTPALSHAVLVHNRAGSERPRRRHRRHSFSQSPIGWRVQVQPARRWPGADRDHRRHPGPGQCAAVRRLTRGPPYDHRLR